MFQYLGAGDAPLFIDMSDDKDREVFLLAQPHDSHGAFAHLRNAPRRRTDVRMADRLDRINDHDLRLDTVCCRHDALEIGLRQNVNIGA